MAGTGLGLGIAGTALALLQRSGNGNGNGVEGVLGSLFGGNNYAAPGGFAARTQVAYDFAIAEKVSKLEAEFTGLKVALAKDAEIAGLKDQLATSNMLRYVDDKTCGMMKGEPFLSPRQMADPYMGQRQVISTHAPVVNVDRNREECGRDWDRWY